MLDPFVVALATALEEVVRRGVEITPTGNGWTVKLASAQELLSAKASQECEPDSIGTQGRSW